MRPDWARRRSPQRPREPRSTTAPACCSVTARKTSPLPYQLFAEALGHYVTHAPPDRLIAHVDVHGSELARLVPALVRRVSYLPRSKAADPETERFLFFAAAAGLLAAASEHEPVIVVLDDLQWADKASLLLLTHIAAAQPAARILVIGTIRDSELVHADALREALGSWQRQGGVSRIELGGLGGPEVVEYMEALAGYRFEADAVGLADAVHRETDGNPFFVSQMVRHLVETGVIYQDSSGRWRADGAMARVELPDSVREVIGGRVVRLGRTHRTRARARRRDRPRLRPRPPGQCVGLGAGRAHRHARRRRRRRAGEGDA